MSAHVMGLSSDPDRIRKNSITQWRHNSSGEIDVFEAARYFSGVGVDILYPNQNVPPHERVLACRISLEMPNVDHNPYNNLAAVDDEKKKMQEKKKYKQPSSPAGKLASFLNSLFNQTTTTSKKTTKKKNMLYKSGSSKNDLEEERKRRSSISHFRITTNHHDSKPSTCAKTTTTPTKSTLRSLSHHQVEVGVSAPTRNGVDQKRITSGNDINYKNNCGSSSLGFSDRSSTMNYYYWGDHDEDRSQSEFNTRKFNNDDDDDDGADSDSSSDLFDLDFCSSSTGNLPVYGTTHVDRIRIHSAPISAVSTIL